MVMYLWVMFCCVMMAIAALAFVWLAAQTIREDIYFRRAGQDNLASTWELWVLGFGVVITATATWALWSVA
jgi:hypothetical protein